MVTHSKPAVRSALLGWGMLLLAFLVIAGCEPNKGHSNSSGDGGELVIFAAASLTDVFTAVQKDFNQEHPKSKLRMNFAGSQSLRTQIENGAQPQIFASANQDHMNVLREAKLVDEPVVFAHNVLVIVVPAGNPAGIKTLADLPNADRLVLAGLNVPAGAYAAKMLAKASRASVYGADFAERVAKKVVSRETHVRQTLQKVVLGEADAAIVYATDAMAAGDKVETIEIPDEHNVIVAYPMATLTGVPNAQRGKRFIDFVASDAVRGRLKEFGFRPVEAGK
jgi:molybdate transport system substrate-binding protein